jgi:hypothetical protein
MAFMALGPPGAAIGPAASEKIPSFLRHRFEGRLLFGSQFGGDFLLGVVDGFGHLAHGLEMNGSQIGIGLVEDGIDLLPLFGGEVEAGLELEPEPLGDLMGPCRVEEQHPLGHAGTHYSPGSRSGEENGGEINDRLKPRVHRVSPVSMA